jgi:hypothetical protein
MNDPVREAFLRRTYAEAEAINAASDTVDLMPLRDGAEVPEAYEGRLRGVEHLVRTAQKTVMVTRDDLPFTIRFPSSYLRSTDPRLPFQVVTVGCALVHPNVRRHLVCLGEHFRPGTSLKALVTQVYRMFSGRSFATAHAFDVEACLYYLAHLDQVSALEAPPLWRRPRVLR